MHTACCASQNGLLASLSFSDYCLVAQRLRKVKLKPRQRLQSAYRPIDTVYFPLSGLVSTVAVSVASRYQAEIAMIGCEGMTGLAVLGGTDRSPHNEFAQVPGEAQCISVASLRDCLEQSGTLMASLARYNYVLGVQCACSVVAAAQGRLEERAARWLLMAQDRLQCGALPVTHELVAWMLGARRAGVTLSLHALQDKGHIRIQRKKLDILDRVGLIKCANSLYGIPEHEYIRLIGCHAKYPMSGSFSPFHAMGTGHH